MLKNKRGYVIWLFITGCILINYGGKAVAEYLNLPLWMDSLGTVLTAYALGPVCGAIVGTTVNIMYGFYSSVSYVYALTNIAVGITVGVCAKKGWLEHVFGTLSMSALVSFVSVVVSTPLNCLFFHGYTNNIWGDGVIDLFREIGFPDVVCYVVGEFYLDFLDKMLTMLLLFAIVKSVRGYKKWKNPLLLFCLIWGLSVNTFGSEIEVYAASSALKQGEKEVDFNTYVQTCYDKDNGLPGGEANDIAQTKDGILWIGTYGGLYRYNGGEFQWMNKYESVKNVNCLYTDEEGRLWIGTNDNGLSICINENISNVVSQDDGLPSNSVRCITESSGGDYYVGTTDSLAVMKISSGLKVYETIPEVVFANSISADKNGNIAVVTDEGGLFLIRGTKVYDRKMILNEGETYSCCTFDEEGNLYAGTTMNHVERYDVSAGRLKKGSSMVCGTLSNIKSLNNSESGVMFVCADNGVGYLDQSGNYESINTNKFNSSIDHMLIDYQGNLWFTSSRLGLLKLCPSAFTEVYSKTGLSEKVVNTIVKWQDRLYFGTDSGLDMVDVAMTGELTDALTRELEGVRIRCLKTDSDNHLWICTSGKGILEVTKKGKIKTYDSSAGALGDKFRMVMELHNGTIAAAGDLGLTFIKDGAIIDTIGYEDGLDNPKVLTLLEMPDGNLLAGTDGNGIAVIKDGKIKDTLKRKDGLSSDVILRMVADSDGEGIFIVTSNSLCFMNYNGQIRILDNFPYYNNYDVVEGRKGELLVLGSAGIYVVDKEKLLRGKTLDYELLNSKKGLRDSLTANSWNYMDDKGGLYLSGDTGVIYMNVNNYDMAVRSYRMLLKTINADDTEYEVDRGQETRIPRGANRIEIVPEIVNYSPNDPYVSVYLEGVDSGPTIIPQSELTSLVYTNLHTGTYTFHLAVIDSKKRSVIEESTYQIIKEKEIYDHWWFQAYVVLVFVLAIVYLTWFILRTQIQEKMSSQKKELDLANETILTIAKTVDAKDENTSQHSLRVAEYSVLIAKELGYDENAREELRKAAMLHDIGKIGIPDRVLNKPDKLTDEEYEIMKSHVVKGAEILKNFTLIDHVADGALYHHERYDGKGYVHGLKGEEIPLNARIIGIADAFDAMTANRVYRKQLDFRFVLEELRMGKGAQFDPKLVDILLGLIEDGVIDITSLYESKRSLG